MTFQQFQTIAQIARKRADRLDRIYYARANACAVRAGVGIGRNVWHNARLSREAGRPWAEVDYQQIREAEYWDRRRMDVHAIADRVSDRAFRQVAR